MRKIYRNSVVYQLFRNDFKVIYRLHCSDYHTFEMSPEDWDQLPNG